MMNDLNPDQLALASLMSELSELAYSAGWMESLEYQLWHAVVNGPEAYGRLSVTEDHIRELGKLSAKCEGWIYFDDSAEETYMDMELWHAKYTDWINS